MTAATAAGMAADGPPAKKKRGSSGLPRGVIRTGSTKSKFQGRMPSACWRPASWSQLEIPRNLSTLHASCQREQGDSIERSRWSSPCDSSGSMDPLEDQYGGALAGRYGTIAVALLGDSVMKQVADALEVALATNPHLSRVRLVSHQEGDRDFVRMSALNLATVPRSVQGSRRLLNAIRWPTNATSRVLLASTGVWYNMWPFCNGSRNTLFGISNATKCGRNQNCQFFGRDRLETNHEFPQWSFPKGFTERMKYYRSGFIPTWGWYSWSRRYKGTATAREFGADVGTFLDAAESWRAQTPGARVVWMESTPQHFAADQSTGCQSTPGTPMGGVQNGPSPEVEAACASSEGRAACIGNWRNAIANPLVRARNVPIARVARALSTRADLHRAGANDCTHWRDCSEATLTLASVALDGIARAIA